MVIVQRAKMYPFISPVLVLVIAILCLPPTCQSSLLGQVNLAEINYSTIHAFAVKDQINLYRVPRRQANVKDAKSLNGVYDFCLDPNERGFEDKWWKRKLKSACQDENFYRMPVPSAFNDITSNSTVQNFIGWFWYQKTIDMVEKPIGTDDFKWYVQFDNVNYLALVWVHGEHNDVAATQSSFVGSHVGGHLPFMLPIKDISSSGIVRLTIAVSNRLTEDTIPSGSMLNLTQVVGRDYYKFQPDFDFFHFSGIMGDISLFKLPPVHITHVDRLNFNDTQMVHLDVCLSTNLTSALELDVLWHTQDYGEFNLTTITELTSQCTIVTWIIDESTWKLSNGKLNSFNEPLIVSISLTEAKKRLDFYELKVSLRRGLEFNATKGLLVNGHPRQLQGFGLHHEQMFSGRTMSQAAIAKDMYLLKRLGVNLVRTSHYPYSEEYLDACDEHGIFVVAECPAVGLKSFSPIKLKLHKQILREMMQRDHHHPSILMWSVANEPQCQLEASTSYFESLLNYTRNELARFTVEAGRPLTAAIAQSYQAERMGQTLDVIMVNHYFGWYDYAGVVAAVRGPLMSSLAGWAHKYPGKGLVVSEFGADTIAGQHSSEATIFSEEYQRDLLSEYERIFDELYSNRTSVNFIGAMVWNFADFSTHQSLMRPGGNRKGVFTRDRQPKLAAHLLQDLYHARIN